MPELTGRAYDKAVKKDDEKRRKLRAMDKKDGGHRYRDYDREEDRKFREMLKHDAEVAREKKREERRKRVLGGSGGRR